MAKLTRLKPARSNSPRKDEAKVETHQTTVHRPVVDLNAGPRSGPAQTPESPEEVENRLFEWLLEQRLLYESGELESEKIRALNQNVPGWHQEVTYTDAAHALAVDDPALNHAFEAWWNATGMSETPMTFAEIRGKAQRES